MFFRNKFSTFLLSGIWTVERALALTAPDISDISAPPGSTGPIQDPRQVIGLLNAILVWVASAFWILAVIFVFYAAYIYLTAGGDPERIKKAHKQLLYAVIAIAVALMAYGMPLLVRNILSAGCINFFIFAVC